MCFTSFRGIYDSSEALGVVRANLPGAYDENDFVININKILNINLIEMDACTHLLISRPDPEYYGSWIPWYFIKFDQLEISINNISKFIKEILNRESYTIRIYVLTSEEMNGKKYIDLCIYQDYIKMNYLDKYTVNDVKMSLSELYYKK